ncbi:hypothetical protein SAY87_025943 [Trapa incisa]|uniref:Dirigent protein n=1 Tax=Trapa incisa TaxID=236973 RepID=A0AAN7GIJ8_9MYRT|nr:hypothetical protein SAY87_025943 [Trapa incisa]
MKLKMMATPPSTVGLLLLLLALIIGFASSARVLVDDSFSDPAVLVSPPGVSNPSGMAENTADLPPPDATVLPDTPLPPVADAAVPEVSPSSDVVADPPLPETPAAASTNPALTTNVVPAGSDATVAVAGATGEPQLSFYMHDIIGGSHPSSRIVTGFVTSTQVNAVPFSKPTNMVFPFNGGVPLANGNHLNGADDLSGIINNNNLPYITGFSGAQVGTVVQSSGNNNQVAGGGNQPFVSAGQLPSGATLQQLMFGTITVVDDELTEGHELGSGVLGKAQGLYLASSLDGTSHTMALTLWFHGNGKDNGNGSLQEVDDTISLFGVHRTASPVSQVAIVGGTGKYGHAKGYATVETLPQENQHTTDGMDTIVHISIYLSE